MQKKQQVSDRKSASSLDGYTGNQRIERSPPPEMQDSKRTTFGSGLAPRKARSSAE